MRNLVVIAFACTACGRVGFSDQIGASTIDAPRVPGPCPVAAVVPDPLIVSGRTYRYTSFDGANVPVASVVVQAVDMTTSTTYGMVTSDASGNYSMSIATGGTAPPITTISYIPQNAFTSTLRIVDPIDRNIIGDATPVWELGDAPVWDTTQMTMVYSAFGQTRDNTKGTINIALRTCDGASIGGVTIAVDPVPGAIAYMGVDGRPTAGPSALPFAHAIVFNAQPGTTKITATSPDHQFAGITLDVSSGFVNTLTVLRPLE